MSDFERYSLIIEAVNAVAAVLVPVLLALGAVLLHRYTTAIDHRLDTEREAVARRGLRFEELSALTNDIYCFTVLVGHYRTISPPDAIEKKRKLEAIMFATLPMWDDQLLEAARDFIAACYITKRGSGQTVLLASDMKRQRDERNHEWSEPWEELFLESDERKAWIKEQFGEVSFRNDGEVSFRNDVVKPRYARFLSAVSRTIGGGLSEKSVLNMLRAG